MTEAEHSVPAAERCAVRILLEQRATAQPDKVYALLPGGREWADAEALADTRRIAAALHWFHTGDAFRRDADGNFYFVERMKDAIRRRGAERAPTRSWKARLSSSRARSPKGPRWRCAR